MFLPVIKNYAIKIENANDDRRFKKKNTFRPCKKGLKKDPLTCPLRSIKRTSVPELTYYYTVFTLI